MPEITREERYLSYGMYCSLKLCGRMLARADYWQYFLQMIEIIRGEMYLSYSTYCSLKLCRRMLARAEYWLYFLQMT